MCCVAVRPASPFAGSVLIRTRREDLLQAEGSELDWTGDRRAGAAAKAGLAASMAPPVAVAVCLAADGVSMLALRAIAFRQTLHLARM